jgi:hypothetical protein
VRQQRRQLQYRLHVAIVTNANLSASSQLKQCFGAEGWSLQVATGKNISVQSKQKLKLNHLKA